MVGAEAGSVLLGVDGCVDPRVVVEGAGDGTPAVCRVLLYLVLWRLGGRDQGKTHECAEGSSSLRVGHWVDVEG